MGDTDAEIICDVAPLSTDGTAMYSSQLQTSFDKNKESFIRLYAFIISLALLSIWGVLIPLLFSFILNKDNFAEIESTAKYINFADLIIIIGGLFAFIISFSILSDKFEDPNNSDANTILKFFGFWLTYSLVNLFYRYLLPTKLVAESFSDDVKDKNTFSIINIM